MRKLAIVMTLTAVSCGGGESRVELLDGFTLPPPVTGEVQLVTPIIRGIEPGADITLCTYIDFDVDHDQDIVNYAGFQSQFGHHVILYSVGQAQAPNTHECTEEDMINGRYLGGGGADSPPQYLPDGIVLRMRAGSQLMIQTHWINTTDEIIDGQGAFNVELVDSSPDAQVADLFTNVTTDIRISPGVGTVGSARAECTLGSDMQFFLMGGHAHE